MTRPAAPRRMADKVRLWPLFDNRPTFVALALLIDVTCGVYAITVLVSGFTSGGLGSRELGLVAFLAVVAVGFEEMITRTARLQLLLSADLKRDMTSVWCIAAAVALTRPAIVVLLGAIFGYVWLRQQRPAGELAYRKLVNFSNVVISCLVASEAAHGVRSAFSSQSAALVGTIVVLAAIVVHSVLNRALVLTLVLNLGVRGRALIGTRDENLIEFATLCLGGLVALAVLTQPFLVVLALAPMVTLQRSAVMRALESAATTDAKTGLLNAVAWEQLAHRELGRASRAGDEVSILIIDIDHFKRVNDRFGHLAGDSMLRLVGKTIAAEVRDYDTVARFGGEEFVAVLPSASTVDALVIAERLRSRVNELHLSSVVDDLDPSADEFVAVSVGVATAPTDGVVLADLLQSADAALYRAKATGRNRVMLADRGPGGHTQTLPFG